MTDAAIATHNTAPALKVGGALPRFAAEIVRHPCWASLVLGAVAACGFQPLAWWPLTLLGVVGLLALTERAVSARRAWLLGWIWGFGHFAVGLNWIATAFTYQAKMPAWLGWGAVLAMALVLGVFPGLASLGGWWFRARRGALVLGLAGCWIVAEWLRSWVFTGFAWNPLGAVGLGPFSWPGLAYQATWLGTYGLSGLVVVLAGCWVLAFMRGRADWRGATLLIGPVLCMMWPGAIRVTDPNTRGIPYTLVQPNIAQAEINDPSLFNDQFARTAALSTSTGPDPRIVLWPESGVPEYLRDAYPAWAYQDTYRQDPALARWRLGRLAGPGSLLLSGTVDLDFSGNVVTGGQNVVTVVDGQGRIAGSYAKAHLVPFGEYLPLRGLLTPLGVAKLIPGDVDLRAGPGPRTLDLGPLGKAGIAICYEIVFSGQVVDRAHRPDYIFAPTNDGWYGDWGPPQHLAQARLRAIEEGLPVLRSTTNGISAVIDADGIVRGAVPRGVAGRLDGFVPPAHPPTLFAAYGNIVPLGWAMLLLGLGVLVLRRAAR